MRLCANALSWVVYWCEIYGYTFKTVILGCVHRGIVVGALVRNPRSAVRVPIMEDFYIWFLSSVWAHLVGRFGWVLGATSIYSRLVYDVFSCATARICLRHLYGVLRGYIIKKGCFLVTKNGCAQVTDEYTHRLRQSVCADAMLLEDIQQSCLHMRRVWVWLCYVLQLSYIQRVFRLAEANIRERFLCSMGLRFFVRLWRWWAKAFTCCAWLCLNAQCR